MLTHRERFVRVLSFEPVDRLPVIEWAGWWDKTVARWHGEGLSPSLTDAYEIRRHFGLDPVQQMWIPGIGPGTPGPTRHGGAIVTSAADYQEVRRFLYPDGLPVAEETLRAWAEEQRRDDLVFWISVEGHFWFPRRLLGIEGHLYAFYDQPALMHAINEDLLRFNLDVIDRVCAIIQPDFMTFAEDMSYNHGPMLSRNQFEEFIAPYYRETVPKLKRAGIRVFVDSDGDVSTLVPWLEEVGVEGMLPLERMAGVDVTQLRRDHPDLRMIGAFDKTVMHRGEERIRQEFERLTPVMRSGGYVPSCDHQTPPEVSLDDYRLYVRLLREYAERAAQ